MPQGEYKNKAYSLRLKNDLMDKIRFIAKKEDRPLSNQFDIMAREYIKQWEQEHGEIEIQKNDNA